MITTNPAVHPRHHAARTPDKPATILSSTGEVRTFAELEILANRGAHLLRAFGLKTDDTIALMIDNTLAYFDLYWSAQRAGLHIVPVATRLTASEVSYILANSGAAVFVCGARFAPIAAAIANGPHAVPSVRHILSVDGTIDGVPGWYDEISGYPATPIADERAGGMMVYSSGTTGRPKGLRTPLADVPADAPSIVAEQWAAPFGIDDQSVYLTPAPLYHTAPLGWSTAVHCRGATVVLMPRFDAEAFLAAVERYGVTHTQMVPTMFVRLLRLPEAKRLSYDLATLRSVIHAAAPCPVPIKHQMIAWIGPILDEFYASSEGHGSTRISSETWLRKPGSVGQAVACTLHICDDTGAEVPAGTDGVVYFGGGRAFAYHDDPAKTAASRHPQHPDWATVGDVGHVDEDGFLYLTDRKDFMIISGGANIYPQEIENVLVSHPSVTDVAVFGVPHEEMGEQVKALVQPVRWEDATPALATELEAWCRQHLSGVKIPRSIEFERELPRADNGKLYKQALKARYWPA